MQVVQYLVLLLERIYCGTAMSVHGHKKWLLLYVPCSLKTVESYLAYKSVLVLVSPIWLAMPTFQQHPWQPVCSELGKAETFGVGSRMQLAVSLQSTYIILF